MISNFFSGERIPVLPVAMAALAILAAPYASPVAAAPSGVCVTTQVTSPFRLPDGVLHPAGMLTLCDTEAFTPVSDLHVVLVDGRRVGIFLSHRRSTEVSGDVRPEVVFDRDAGGSLDLIGYILPSSGRSVAYQLKPHPARSSGLAANRPGVSDAGPILAAAMAASVP
ncbi:MAG TPA: hypothetical protein VMR65_10950 [Candidatus Sulfotelmatobacter sp.]|jgi:hypothetical protein|nr:hypothetical protein [Candidatus Sulfotelmatobacter sp.]